MIIHYLFSKNNKCGSKLISWASSFEVNLDKCPSHVAVLLNNKLVLESTFKSGVRLVPYAVWKQINEELYKIPCSQILRSSNEITDEVNRIWGASYDWKGIIYFTYCFLRLMLFKEPLPKRNKWQRNKYFFCTELAGRISGIDYQMTTPAKMLLDILDKK